MLDETSREMNAEQAWCALLSRYNIVHEVEQNGIFHITAAQIKEYKEPRIMAKWDSSESLPSSLKTNNLNILPDSRGSYVIGDFILYQEIPELTERVEQMTQVQLGEYETIDVNNITSEANAINVLVLSGILDDFLEASNTVVTFNGRMGTGYFNFEVDTHRNIKRRISVNNAQCEIDGGFENSNNVVILEAKNVLHKDFHVRQLYYPYRLWKEKVNKPIRLILSVYSNMIYRLFEYRFNTLEDYSSIELIQTKNYSLQDIHISHEDLMGVRRNTVVTKSDNIEETDIPFIQADSVNRLISLLENMENNPMTKEQIMELMEFVERQYDYYVSAGIYLGIFERVIRSRIVKLTRIGELLCRMTYKERQLKLVSLMVEHQIFAIFFDHVIESNGELPTKQQVCDKMRVLNVCGDNETTIGRRASSVLGWLRWIFNLPNLG
ncbi:type II restriction enzyme [Desulfovibrio sp. SGI.169]|uniref:type II restriction enzyme n=1 Tax=Desulfovibrio sp. SGI.169 TaxID=3420561 RepID=UPI003CFE6B38